MLRLSDDQVRRIARRLAQEDVAADPNAQAAAAVSPDDIAVVESLGNELNPAIQDAMNSIFQLQSQDPVVSALLQGYQGAIQDYNQVISNIYQQFSKSFLDTYGMTYQDALYNSQQGA